MRRMAHSWRREVKIRRAAVGPARGETRPLLDGHKGTVSCLAYAPDGSQLASGSWDQTVRLWDPTEKNPAHLGGHTGDVTCLAYAPNGSQLASGSEDGTVRLWDPAGEKASLSLDGHTSSVMCLDLCAGWLAVGVG